MWRAAEKHPASSPITSPIAIAKSKRRRRTLIEFPSPHTTVSVTHSSQCSLPDISEMVKYGSPAVYGISIKDFTLNAIEGGNIRL